MSTNFPNFPNDGQVIFSNYNGYKFNFIKKRWIPFRTDSELIPRLNLNFENGILDPRINFSRTSNATVTRADGTIGYAPMNLLTFSEQFDNAAWVKTASTIAANSTTAPNGTATADKVVDSSANAQHFIESSITSTIPCVLSVYAKASELPIIYLYASGVNKGKYFNLTTGTVGSNYVAAPDSASIEPLGNGWYRCSISVQSVTSPRIGVCKVDNGSVYVGNGTDGLFIWGAQLEIGSTATTYNSTTPKNRLGFSELFDNAAWTKSNSFVQTNLLTYSEAFDNAAWLKGTGGVGSAPVVTANAVIAPNGYQTADTIVLDLNDGTTSADLSWLYQNYSVTTGLVYTFSIYVKANTANDVGKQVRAGGIAYTDIITLTASWQRVTITATALSTGTVSFGFRLRGNEITNDVSMDVWGAQLVQGSVAGDYRRTDAAALPIYYPNHNGVVCAEKLVENTTTGAHQVFTNTYSAPVTGTYTYSIYAKAAEGNRFLSVYPQATTVGWAIFNLTNGTRTVSGGGGLISSSITPVGNGWYRCSVTWTATAGTVFAVCYLTNSSSAPNATYTGDGTSGIYIFGAQLSDSASLDPYVLNAGTAPTAAAYYGPRFDYDPVTLQPKGLLIEEQRSNLALQSENFAVTWTMTGGTISPNQITAPNGTLTGAKLIASSASSAKYLNQAVTTVASTVYSWSAYLKAGEYSTAVIYFISVSSPFENCSATINLATGVITASSGGAGATLTGTSITPAGNGWYRCTLIGTIGAKTNMAVRVYPNTTAAFTGDDVSGVYIWGAQLEAGAFATSYIPTVASQVTRTADVASIDGSNFIGFYNQNEGSVYYQASTEKIAPAGAPVTQAVSISNSTNTDIVLSSLHFDQHLRVFYNGSSLFSLNSGVLLFDSQFNKLAFAIKNNDFAVSSLGRTPVTNNSGTLGGSMIRLKLEPALCGNIKSISYYPIRLSNDVLKGLTA
jgi:hypothetical protein